MFSNGHMTLDGIIFYCVRYFPFMVMVRCVRTEASVRPRISDYAIMNLIVKGGIFEFI